jgi:hypothetical protein
MAALASGIGFAVVVQGNGTRAIGARHVHLSHSGLLF